MAEPGKPGSGLTVEGKAQVWILHGLPLKPAYLFRGCVTPRELFNGSEH